LNIVRKWFYVLELAGGNFYVGISGNAKRRHQQHIEGKGAAWARLHKPKRVLFQHEHEVADCRAAELLENEITVRLMCEHGWKKVRGGYFCALDESSVEASLRAHGHWIRVLQSTVRASTTLTDWSSALESLLQLAECYFVNGAKISDRDALFAQMCNLRAHHHWRPDLEPALEEQFWGSKGVLRVLLSIRLNRVIGFKLQDPFAVLHAGLQMGSAGQQPWAHLFLLAWDAYQPDCTETQLKRVSTYLASSSKRVPNRRFDPFVAMLFPEMRWRIQA
jgi:predicted GIY-YIG superfamily endonuclease